MKKVGELRCDVCDFSFTEKYGELGAGYIEAHHTVPVSSIRGKHKTRILDISLVCSNCHRMLHRSKPMKSIMELRRDITANQ
ncbi:MAG: HNH endonuclease [bacterium]|nr:HNH endonuclease [bacterium]